MSPLPPSPAPSTSPPPPPPAAGRPVPADRERAGGDRPPWPLWSAPAGVAFGLMLGVLATLLVDIVAHAGPHPGPAASIIGDIAFDLGAVAAVLWLVSRLGRPQAADFGYRRLSWRKAIRAFVLAAFAYYGLTAVYSVLLHLRGSDKLPSDLGVTHSTAALIAASAFVCVIAPMAEEFFFRGFFFGVLRGMHVRVLGRELGPWIAAIVTGILFGLAHTGSAGSQYLIPLGFLGFVLCIVRWRTGSLYPCMALHSANNALALGYNQLSFNAAEIVGLIIGSWLIIGAITGPLAGPWRAGAGTGDPASVS